MNEEEIKVAQISLAWDRVVAAAETRKYLSRAVKELKYTLQRQQVLLQQAREEEDLALSEYTNLANRG